MHVRALSTAALTHTHTRMHTHTHTHTRTHTHTHAHTYCKTIDIFFVAFSHTLCTHAHMYTAHVQPATRASYPTKTAKGCNYPSVEFSRVPRKYDDETVVWPRPDREARSLSEAIVRANGMFRMLLCMDVRLVHPTGHLFCKIGMW